MRFRMGAATVLALVLVAGCQANRGFEAEFEGMKNEFNLQLALMKRHSDFLQKKVANVENKLAEAEKLDRTLSADLATYVAGPERVKREILGDVETRAQASEEARASYMAGFVKRLDDQEAELNRRANEVIGRGTRTLEERDRFFRFVFTAQDSVNGVFASRFDQRPWYQSVIGRWEERRPSE